MREQILEWIRSQQAVLDKAIADAASNFHLQNKDTPHFAFDVKTTSSEMWALSKQDDLCYDRPSIGFCYGMWYHATRVSTLVPIFEHLLHNSPGEDRIDIFDIGAGTGAIQWAVAISLLAREASGQKTPPIRIVNIDSSPFMLDFNKNFLWVEFCEAFPKAASIKVEYTINNWTNHVDPYQANNWICASYVFDHFENRTSLAEEFGKLVERIKPSTVLLFTSSQNAQEENLNHIIDRVGKEGYVASKALTYAPLFTGVVTEVNSLRKKLQAETDFGFSGDVLWNRGGFIARILTRQQIGLPLQVDAIKVYHSPEITRAKVQLTDQQRSAAEPNGQPTIIVGPAGCGKSVVLTEKIKRIVERVDKPYDHTVRILLTTFNRRLVRVLGDWLEEILDPKQCKRTRYTTTTSWGKTYTKDHCWFQFNGSKIHNIEVVHFDVMPTLIGKVPWRYLMDDGYEYEVYHRKIMQEAIDLYFKTEKLSQEKESKIANPDFLLDEFVRIFYGQQVKKKKHYLTIERTGRGNNPFLKYKSQRREIIFECISIYLKKLKDAKRENFHMRRSKFLNKLAAGDVERKFDYILIDELQDCTKADHQIFLHLIKDASNITFAGDLAQSIQLGAAFHVPMGEEMTRFKKIKLEGSFRLPFRISECLKQLSERINKRYGAREGVEAEIIVPYRGAQPGARPIVVYSQTAAEMAIKITAVIKKYSLYGLSAHSLFERDNELAVALYENGVFVENDIILKSKGLEYSCVIWSSRLRADTNLEQQEFAYTIFTRTSSILIIAVFDPIEAELKDITKIFDSKKSIYWDQETSEHMNTVHQTPNLKEGDDTDQSPELEEDANEAIDLDQFIE